MLAVVSLLTLSTHGYEILAREAIRR